MNSILSTIYSQNEEGKFRYLDALSEIGNAPVRVS
jgi:hypothetical protein